MEDLAGKITELLGNPEIMNKVKGLSGLLGQEEESTGNSDGENPGTNEEFPAEALHMMMKLMPLLSSMKKDDKHTRFLQALRPLLSEGRQKKLDSSAQILKIIQILPLLKNQGLF